MGDVLLLSLPNKNMDYPALSLPALASSLKKQGYDVAQRDLNIEIRDNLLTPSSLLDLTTKVLPVLARENINSPRIHNKISQAIKLLTYIQKEWSFPEFEKTKELMKARCYSEVFKDETRFNMAMCLFQGSRFLHQFLDIYTCRPTIFEDCGARDPIQQILDGLATYIKRFAPNVIGFTVLDIQRRFTLWFARRLRQSYEGKIVFGGADPSRFGGLYLELYPFVDHVFVKEAEDSFPQFLSEMGNTKRWERVPGLGFRKDGKTRVNEVDPVDANSIPTPDFSGLALDKYLLPTLPVQASRGCHWEKCKFCIHGQTYSPHYRRPIQHVVDDLETLSHVFNARFFHFTDDYLAVDLGTQISDEIIRRNLDIRWLTYARLEKHFDGATLSKWHRAGARVIEWGLESASQYVLNLMDKGIQIEEVQPILDNAAHTGILSKLFCFHNYPGESIEDLKETLHFLRYNILNKRMRPFLPIRNKLFLLKGSILYEEAVSGGSACPFAKVWIPNGPFSIQADYEDFVEYEPKKNLVEGFLRETQDYIQEKKIFTTDDENVTMDLVIIDLQEKGYPTARGNI